MLDCAHPLGSETQANESPRILIADDDAAMRISLVELMASVGLESYAFKTGQELLDAQFPDHLGCLILDVRMPGISGVDLLQRLVAAGIRSPVIIITAHGDVPMTIQAMKAGAVDFLTKPLRLQVLLDAVHLAISADRKRRRDDASQQHSRALFATLTSRERQIFASVANGRLNKQMAFDLSISEVTVKLHRGNLMRKLDVGSVAELVRLWMSLPALLRSSAEDTYNCRSARRRAK